MSEATWIDVDSRRVLPGADQDRVQRFGTATVAARQLHRCLPGILHLIRDYKAGQPRAASYTPSASSGSLRAVDDGEEVATGHHDPTGDAGIVPDRAAAHEREVRRLLDRYNDVVADLLRVTVQYPVAAMRLEDVEPTPGDDWCKSCWKDNHHCEPIAQRPDGTPRFPGLCRWCGEFRQANGFEPPTAMLAARHRGERITEGMVNEARKEHARQNPKTVKRKGGKGRRRYSASAPG